MLKANRLFGIRKFFVSHLVTGGDHQGNHACTVPATFFDRGQRGSKPIKWLSDLIYYIHEEKINMTAVGTPT